MISLFLAGDVRGAPWHGICKDGLLFAYDGTTPVPPTGPQHVCPSMVGRFIRPVQPIGGGDALTDTIRITCTATARPPDVPAINRTTEQQAHDADLGRTWLDHFQMPRDQYGTWFHAGKLADDERTRQWLLSFGPGDVWRMRITSASYILANDRWDLTVTGIRYGRHGEAPQQVSHDLAVMGLGNTQGPRTVFSFSTYTQMAAFAGYAPVSMDETDDGQKTIIGLAEWYDYYTGNPRPHLHGIVVLDFTGWPNSAPTASMLADHGDCEGSGTRTFSAQYSGSNDIYDECLHYATGVYHSERNYEQVLWAWFSGQTAVSIAMRVVGVTNSSETFGKFVQGQTIQESGYPLDSSVTDSTTYEIRAGGTIVYSLPLQYSASSSGLHDAYELGCVDGPASVNEVHNDPPNHHDLISHYLGTWQVLRARRLLMLVSGNAASHQIKVALGPDGERGGYPTVAQSGALYLAMDDQHDMTWSSAPIHWI